MARIRSNNVFGTTTNNPLAAGGTTLNSAGLANLAAVSGGNEAIITLDPNRVHGAPEIVVVTAHTGSATSATIVRGQFGTTARSHPVGTEWVHGPIASNAAAFTTAADDQGDFVPLDEWETWTPTFTNFTPGSAAIVAKFVRVGRTIHWRLSVTLSGSTMGDVRFTLPVAPASSYLADQDILGVATYVDANGATWSGKARFTGTASIRCVYMVAAGTDAALSTTAPFTWANGDTFALHGTYEAAS